MKLIKYTIMSIMVLICLTPPHVLLLTTCNDVKFYIGMSYIICLFICFISFMFLSIKFIKWFDSKIK